MRVRFPNANLPNCRVSRGSVENKRENEQMYELSPHLLVSLSVFAAAYVPALSLEPFLDMGWDGHAVI